MANTTAAWRFRLVPNGDRTKWTYYDIHNFCASKNCSDGALPTSELIIDSAGNLYGTTSTGGTTTAPLGVVYKLTRGANGWTLSVIHTFKNDGAVYSGLSYVGQHTGAPWNQVSPLLGVTTQGGKYGKGTIFELTPNGSGFTYKIIHSFKTSSPAAFDNPLYIDSSGKMYGLTSGNSNVDDAGTLYEVDGGTFQVTILHGFCKLLNCTDGAVPAGPLTKDHSGNIFGTTVLGGVGNGESLCASTGFYFNGCGVAFEYSVQKKFSIVHNFCSLIYCGDGAFPYGGVIVDTSGTLYGTASDRPDLFTFGYGKVFSLSYTQNQWSETVLCEFGDPNCIDGAGPSGGLTMDGSGYLNLFGTTYGWQGSPGNVFEIPH